MWSGFFFSRWGGFRRSEEAVRATVARDIRRAPLSASDGGRSCTTVCPQAQSGMWIELTAIGGNPNSADRFPAVTIGDGAGAPVAGFEKHRGGRLAAFRYHPEVLLATGGSVLSRFLHEKGESRPRVDGANDRDALRRGR